MPYLEPLPEDLFDPGLRHLFFLAHFDDEAPYAGIISRLQRLGRDVHIAWLTNGDGLAYQDNANPDEYAESRKSESLCAAGVMDVPRGNLHFLDWSEIEIYRNFTLLPDSQDAIDLFRRIDKDVDKMVRKIKPDVLWVLAFQGGQPEHDLSHLFSVKCARKIGVKHIFEMPEYEYTILLPFRFRPWLKMPIHEIILSDTEFRTKNSVVECYPTQKGLINSFMKVVSVITTMAKPFNKGMDLNNFLARETFATVPPDRDYTTSPHINQAFDYMFDDYKGLPIKFNDTLSVIAKGLKND